ncbi:MAG: DUF4177 domain-containing protein [Flavobacteriaceae bacterium]
MTYQYRCVAGPSNINVRNDRERAKAVQAYEDIINQEAEDGWEYVSMGEYHTTTPPGCWPGSKPEIATLKILVFRRATR